MKPVAARVTHGDLAYARFPVVIGHYEQDAIVSAEARLDRVLAGALRRCHGLGSYPGALGTAQFVADPDGRLPGALVLGLGEVGSLTAASLSRTVEHGVQAWLNASPASPRRRREASSGLSLLLIGTGSGGIPVSDAVTALLRGVLRAVSTRATTAGWARSRIQAVDIVELYEDRAILAARALELASEDPELGAHFQWAPRVVRTGGARRRASYREDERWWRRLQILEGPQGSLVFNALTERARAEVRLQPTQRLQVDEFLERALRESADDAAVAVTLNELLVPAELREQARDRRDVVLVLDEDTARYPWELLRERPAVSNGRQGGRSSRPPAPQVTEAGVVRQLSTSTFREPVASTSVLKALVVGDPPSDFPPLDGAVREAEAVGSRLRAHGYDVTTRIRVRADDVVASLFGSEYRILHLAGHGVYRYASEAEPDRAPITGMVIGPGVYLTAADITRMTCVPQVVFLNCCHLGVIERQDRLRDRAREATWTSALWSARSAVAANLATEFIRMGARVVIAAGWTVDDAAASFFATSVYERMLEGQQAFGRAVTEARRRTYQRYPRVNTWGAYQCYGDPHFTLVPAEPADDRRALRPMTAGELAAELETVALQAVEADADRVGLRKQFATMVEGVPDEWLGQGDVRERMARACLALEEPTRAFVHFERALISDRQSASIAAIGEYAVAQTARAAALARVGRGRRLAASLLAAGRQRLEWLLGLGETPRRLAWMGVGARHALVLARAPSARLELLREVSHYARRAYMLARHESGEADPGLLLDWVYADLGLHLARQRSRPPAALVARVQRAHRVAVARFEDTHLSSDALMVADALAARHVMQGDLTSARACIARACRGAGRAEGHRAAGLPVSARLELLAEVLAMGGRIL